MKRGFNLVQERLRETRGLARIAAFMVYLMPGYGDVVDVEMLISTGWQMLERSKKAQSHDTIGNSFQIYNIDNMEGTARCSIPWRGTSGTRLCIPTHCALSTNLHVTSLYSAFFLYHRPDCSFVRLHTH